MLNFIVRTALADVDIGNTYGPAKTFPTVGDLLNTLVPNLLTVAGVIAFISVVVAGLGVISHAGKGEGEKTAKSSQAFTAAIVGLIIIFGAYFILKIIETLTGYNFLSPNI